MTPAPGATNAPTSPRGPPSASPDWRALAGPIAATLGLGLLGAVALAVALLAWPGWFSFPGRSTLLAFLMLAAVAGASAWMGRRGDRGTARAQGIVGWAACGVLLAAAIVLSHAVPDALEPSPEGSEAVLLLAALTQATAVVASRLRHVVWTDGLAALLLPALAFFLSHALGDLRWDGSYYDPLQAGVAAAPWCWPLALVLGARFRPQGVDAPGWVIAAVGSGAVALSAAAQVLGWRQPDIWSPGGDDFWFTWDKATSSDFLPYVVLAVGFLTAHLALLPGLARRGLALSCVLASGVAFVLAFSVLVRQVAGFGT